MGYFQKKNAIERIWPCKSQQKQIFQPTGSGGTESTVTQSLNQTRDKTLTVIRNSFSFYHVTMWKTTESGRESLRTQYKIEKLLSTLWVSGIKWFAFVGKFSFVWNFFHHELNDFCFLSVFVLVFVKEFWFSYLFFDCLWSFKNKRTRLLLDIILESSLSIM